MLGHPTQSVGKREWRDYMGIHMYMLRKIWSTRLNFEEIGLTYLISVSAAKDNGETFGFFAVHSKTTYLVKYVYTTKK